MNHRLWQTRFYQVALLGGLCAGALWLVLRLRVVFVPMILGTFIAYALKPMVGWLRRHRVPGFIVLSLPLGLVIAIGVLLVGVVIPGLARELMVASRALPDQIQSALHTLDPIMLERFDFRAYFEGDALRTHLEQTLVGLWARDLHGDVDSIRREAGVGDGGRAVDLRRPAFVIDDFDLVMDESAWYLRATRTPSIGWQDRHHAARPSAACCCCFCSRRGHQQSALLKVPFAGLVGPVAATIYRSPTSLFGDIHGASFLLASRRPPSPPQRR